MFVLGQQKTIERILANCYPYNHKEKSNEDELECSLEDEVSFREQSVKNEAVTDALGRFCRSLKKEKEFKTVPDIWKQRGTYNSTDRAQRNGLLNEVRTLRLYNHSKTLQAALSKTEKGTLCSR